MKIIFLQLPLIDHYYNYIDGNIPYASATLAAYINKKFKGKHSVEYLPTEFVNFVSDSIIIKYLLKSEPDIIAYTNYLWNAERNINIAEMIKKKNSKIVNIFGGPEINEGSFLFKKIFSEVDIFFIGEGEWFFKKYLSNCDLTIYSNPVNKNLIIRQPEDELLKVNELVEPFSTNYLNPMHDGSIFFEQTRGCPYKCSYCFYSKNSNKVRDKNFDFLINLLKIGKKRKLQEIYLLCPTFNHLRNFKDKLLLMKKINHNISLHTEMRTDNIDNKIAKMIYNAGFKSLEVGLQTMTPNALKKANRTSNIDRELKGIQYLKKSGIDLKIGIIPGLPGDTPKDFIKTIDILLSEKLEDNIELYPLMVLPGTKMLSDAIKENFVFQKKPPYFLLSSNTFNLTDFVFINDYLQEKTGYFHQIKRLPDFIIDNNAKYFNAVYFNGDLAENWSNREYNKYIDSNVFSFRIKMKSNINLFLSLKDLFRDKKSSSELYNIIFYSDIIINENQIMNFLKSFDQDCFYQRINYFKSWSESSRIHFYQVIENFQLYLDLVDSYQAITPLFRLTEENYYDYKNYQGEVIDIIISKNSFQPVREKIIKEYKEYPENISFENIDDLKEFYSYIKLEYVEYAMSFNCKNLVAI